MKQTSPVKIARKVPQPIVLLLYVLAGGRCEFSGCNNYILEHHLTRQDGNFGETAHIVAFSKKGPRGGEKRPTNIHDLNNLMLLCLGCHKLIDNNPADYPVDMLREWKLAHEQRIRTVTAISQDKTSYVIIYKGLIREHQPKIDYRDVRNAMLPYRYPASPLPIELGLANSSYKDHEEIYWQTEEINLDRNFKLKIKPLLDCEGERNHLSVFAFAPQPLLIKLGSLLSDVYPIEVYQIHKEPQTLAWQPGPEKFEYLIQESTTAFPHVALKLALCATINSCRIEQVLSGKKYSEWQMTIAKPDNDFLKSREQLRNFRQEFRSLLDRIKTKHGENAVIHLFPSVPVSVAVEIGRVRQAKADLPLVIYDQNKKMKRFIYALTIGEEHHG